MRKKQVLRKARIHRKTRSSRKKGTLKKGRILFIENVRDFLKATAPHLRRAGYQVVPAYSLAEAHRLLREQWFRLAIIDIRLENDTDPYDYSGLRLAMDPDYAFVAKVILTMHESGLHNVSLPGDVVMFLKGDNSGDLIRFVNDFFRTRVRINWKLRFEPDPQTQVSVPLLLARLEPIDSEKGAARTEELEDLFRKLFYEKEAVTFKDVLWHRDGRLALTASCFKEQVGEEFFVVTVGERKVIGKEKETYHSWAPKIHVATATVLAESAETTHYAANAYALHTPESSGICSLRAFYASASQAVFTRALETLFGKTLLFWHRNQQDYSVHTWEVLYQERLGLDLRQLSDKDWMERVLLLVKQSVLSGLGLGVESDKLVVNFKPELSYPISAAVLRNTLCGRQAARVMLSPGTLSGDNILADTEGRAWLTDLAEAGPAPLPWNFVCLEACVRFDWIDETDIGKLHELEQELITDRPRFEDVLVPAPLSALRKPLAAVQEIRRLAAPLVREDRRAYHLGIFFQAVRRLLDFKPDAHLGKTELARLAHACLAVAMIADKMSRRTEAKGIQYDAAKRVVFVDGRPVKLTPLGLRIFLHLYQNERLCSWEEIFKAAYPGERSFGKSQKDKLTKAIHELRRRIGASYLEVRHGHGLQLIRKP